MNGSLPAVRALVRRRDDGVCAWCGAPILGAFALHRRRYIPPLPRRRPAPCPADVVLVCSTGGCARLAWSGALARRRGFRLPAISNPATRPILYASVFGAAWVLLDHDGSLTPMKEIR